MADADWYRYKQLRGKELPATFEFAGVHYQLRKLLKRDFYAVVGLYDRASDMLTLPAQVLLKVYHTDALWGLPLGWLGRWLARREIRAFEALAHVAGIPHLLAPWGESGMIREFIAGCNLREYRANARPDERFYPELFRILADVHACGMSHNDLAKPENIVVTDEGQPILIDFQIALGPRLPRWPIVGWLARRFLHYMQSVDVYHLRKHHTSDRPEDYTDEDRRRARQKGTILWLHGVVLRKPYRAVRHFVLRRWLLDDRTRRAA
jgi:hypothetical protein